MREFTEQELIRREKAEELRNKGIDPFGQKIDVTTNSEELKQKYVDNTKEELIEMNIPVVIAGRIMTKRGKGKVGFMHIQDKFFFSLCPALCSALCPDLFTDSL